MNAEEKIAHEYLVGCGHASIVFEPNGKIPPDFAVDTTIGVEVRRLNHNYFGGEVVQGMESDDIRLNAGIRDVLKEFDEPIPIEAYWIQLEFARPVGNLKRIKDRIRLALRSFLHAVPPLPHEIRVTPKVSITILPASHKRRQRFQVGIESDEDNGGWVIPTYRQNIEHCCREKADKIRPYLSKYDKWWLLLVNTLFVIPPDEVSEVVRDLAKPEEWARVVVIDPRTRTKIIEF